SAPIAAVRAWRWCSATTKSPATVFKSNPWPGRASKCRCRWRLPPATSDPYWPPQRMRAHRQHNPQSKTMAETYSENDELNQLLGWLKTNGPALAVGLILGLIVVVGWKWWQAHVENQAQAAAQLYGSFVQEVQNDAADQARADAEQLKQDFSSSPYAANAAFRLAAVAVGDKHYDKALGQLDWVLANSASVPVKSLARLRKARVLW